MSDQTKMLYSSAHLWVSIDGSLATVGLSCRATDLAGDFIFAELPQVGVDVTRGQVLGTAESLKSVIEIEAPVSGAVIEVNEALEERPRLINDSPFGGGWLIRIRLDRPVVGLLDAEQYAALVVPEERSRISGSGPEPPRLGAQPPCDDVSHGS